jgi:glycosyltransferase involved in cell wall biosynthesis
MARNDVAIYAPFAGGNYDRTVGRSGGAERQMTVLASVLSASGHRVAHIVYPPHDPIPISEPNLTLVARRPYAGGRFLIGGLLDCVRIWRALHSADGRVVIVREASPVVALAALFAKLRRRRFVFSSANNSNFVFDGTRRLSRLVFGLGIRAADVVVVQSQDQIELARRAFPSLRRVVHIASFADAPPTSASNGGPPNAFLWIGRVVSYKGPLRYVELARAVPEARFVMVPERYGADAGAREELRAAADGIRNLELIEPRPREELMGLIEDAVAVVNTSTLEGMPNVFLEAWARGVPVLTLEFDPDGVVARRGLGVTARGSWDRFVAGARDLWHERASREEMSRRVQAYVEETHSVNSVVADWIDLIDSLVGDSPAAAPHSEAAPEHPGRG